MEPLLLWVPYRAFMPTPVPLLRRMLAGGEISELIPGRESLPSQLQRIAAARLLFVDQSFLNALHGVAPYESWTPDFLPAQTAVQELMAAVQRSSAPRVLGLTWNDLHWLNVPGNPNCCAADLAGFARQFQGLVWSFEQWGDTASGALPILIEPWMEQAGSPRENWRTLTAGIAARFDYTFALNAGEVRRVSAQPAWDASVIGARYSSRALAHDSALSENLSVAPFRRIASLTDRALRLRRRLLPRRGEADLAVRRRVMDSVVVRSRANFVCGGGVRYFVRKYFEFAAVGGCIASWPAAGMRHYGFRDGEHLAVCGEPSDFGKTARWLRPRTALRESMGTAAQAMVNAKHTLDVRAAQMLAWLRELARGRDVRGVWHEGEFQLVAA
jgi:hypothetical protein